jgi:hypothetical protein
MENWKKQTIATGAAIGLLTGIAAAFILIQQAEHGQKQPSLNAGTGVKVGLGLLGILRLLMEPGSGK